MKSSSDLTRPSRDTLLWLLILVGAGTALRLWIILAAEEWKLVSVHNAWQLLLDEAVDVGLRFDQLIQYPHELGGLLLSLPALALTPVRHWIPTLAVSVLILDSLVRVIQIGLAWRLFGRTVGIWFGVWSVAALPACLLWSGTGSDLHALSAVFPFLLMWLGTERFHAGRFPRWLLLGVFLGLAIAWSFSTLVLVPVALTVVWLSSESRQRAANLGRSLATMVLVLLVLVIPATSYSDGYALESHSPFWTQVQKTAVPSIGTWWSKFRLGWTHSLPGASVLPALDGLSLDRTRLVWALVLYLGLVLACFEKCRRPPAWIGLGCIVVFMALYPFHTFWLGVRDRSDHSAYLFYRHLPIILPAVVVISLHGFLHHRLLKRVFPALLVGMGLVPALILISSEHPFHEVAVRPQAWVLGRKLGHNPQRLAPLLRLIASHDRDEFLIGYGWGLGVAGLVLAHPPSESPKGVAAIVRQYPAAQRTKILEGIDYAFEENTPGLDPRLKLSLYEELEGLVPGVAPPTSDKATDKER